MMEEMRLQAGWQTLRQVKAVDAYKNEGYRQFQVLLSTIQHDVAHTIYHVNLVKQPAPSPAAQAAARAGGVRQPQPVAARSSSTMQSQTFTSDSSSSPPKVGGKKVGRNDPCPCGSGKKYKHCCGK